MNMPSAFSFSANLINGVLAMLAFAYVIYQVSKEKRNKKKREGKRHKHIKFQPQFRPTSTSFWLVIEPGPIVAVFLQFGGSDFNFENLKPLHNCMHGICIVQFDYCTGHLQKEGDIVSVCCPTFFPLRLNSKVFLIISI